MYCQEFAPVDATWHYTYLEFFFNLNHGAERIVATKNTILNNKLWRILKKSYTNREGQDEYLGNEYIHVSGDNIFRLSIDGVSIFYIISILM